MTYNILDYGARTSDALQTRAIQSAIDACFLAGGGEVRVPAGVYRTGCIRLRSNITLYLESGAILEGSRDPEDYTGYINDAIEPIITEDDPALSRSVYPYSRWMNAVIRVHNAENVKIIGEKGSFIDGMNCYDRLGEEKYRGPHGICIHESRNIYLEGYTVKNSSNWAHAIFKTQDIVMRNVTVYGGHDGFDVRVCDNVLVEDCHFNTGDDCIAGFDNNDVIIRRCYMETACSAVRFGGNNVLVEDCVGGGPSGFGCRATLGLEKKQANVVSDEDCRHDMVDVFLYYCDGRANPRRKPGDILFRNCRFNCVGRIFSLEFDGKHVWCSNRSLSSIKFENCVFENLDKPAYIYGDANEPLTFALENVTLTAREGSEGKAVVDARNFAEISMKNVRMQGYDEARIDVRTAGKVNIEESDPVRVVEYDSAEISPEDVMDWISRPITWADKD